MLRQFADRFKKTEDGTRRDWMKIQEEQIKELFDTNKEKSLLLIE